MNNKESFLKLVSNEKTQTVELNRLRIKWRKFLRLTNKIKYEYKRTGNSPKRDSRPD